MMILLSLPVKSHMYDILLLVYQDAATQESLFQFHRKDLIFLIRLSPIYTRSKTSFNVRTNLLLLSLKFQNLNKYNLFITLIILIILNQHFVINQSIIYIAWNNLFIFISDFFNLIFFCVSINRICFF